MRKRKTFPRSSASILLESIKMDGNVKRRARWLLKDERRAIAVNQIPGYCFCVSIISDRISNARRAGFTVITVFIWLLLLLAAVTFTSTRTSEAMAPWHAVNQYVITPVIRQNRFSVSNFAYSVVCRLSVVCHKSQQICMSFGRYTCGVQWHCVRWGSLIHKGRGDMGLNPAQPKIRLHLPTYYSQGSSTDQRFRLLANDFDHLLSSSSSSSSLLLQHNLKFQK